MMQLSIIVPVYNVEKYVRPCIESIFKQGLDEDCFEVIIINDGTQDNSMEVIQDIIEAHQNITVINQENQGLSVARNNGIEKATGEYLMFVDSDDLLIENSVPYLLDKAISSESDLVVADFLRMNNEEIALFQQELIKQKDGNILKMTGKDMLNQDLNFGYSCVWHTLFNKSFLDKNNIRFIPHIYFEDTPFTHQCYARAEKCLKANWLLNIYRIRQESITSSFNKKKGMDYCIAINEVWKIAKEEQFSLEIRHKIQNNVYIYFSTLLYLLTTHGALLHNEKIEVIKQLKELVPDLSFKHGIKQRIVSFFYRKLPSEYFVSLSFYAKIIQNKISRIKKTIKPL